MTDPWPLFALSPADGADAPPRGTRRLWPRGRVWVWDGERWREAPPPFEGGDSWLREEDEAA